MPWNHSNRSHNTPTTCQARILVESSAVGSPSHHPFLCWCLALIVRFISLNLFLVRSFLSRRPGETCAQVSHGQEYARGRQPTSVTEPIRKCVPDVCTSTAAPAAAAAAAGSAASQLRVPRTPPCCCLATAATACDVRFRSFLHECASAPFVVCVVFGKFECALLVLSIQLADQPGTAATQRRKPLTSTV